MGKPSPEDDASERIGDLLDQAMDLNARFLSDRADLSASAAFVLNRLHREGPVRLTSLAAKEGISQPAMTQLVQRLERHDLVTRVADPGDGRAALIGITDHGQALLEARKRIRRDRLKQLLTALSPDEQRTLRASALEAFPVLRRLAEEANCPLDQRKVFE